MPWKLPEQEVMAEGQVGFGGQAAMASEVFFVFFCLSLSLSLALFLSFLLSFNFLFSLSAMLCEESEHKSKE